MYLGPSLILPVPVAAAVWAARVHGGETQNHLSLDELMDGVAVDDLFAALEDDAVIGAVLQITQATVTKSLIKKTCFHF